MDDYSSRGSRVTTLRKTHRNLQGRIDTTLQPGSIYHHTHTDTNLDKHSHSQAHLFTHILFLHPDMSQCADTLQLTQLTHSR